MTWDGVWRRRSLVFKNFRLGGWGKRLFLGEFGNRDGGGLGFGRLGRLFFVQALSRIHNLSWSHDCWLGQWKARAAYKANVSGVSKAASTGPLLAVPMKICGRY